jgi:ssDNA-binding Zn-finger/Zn-ribbon topoisomerase 1
MRIEKLQIYYKGKVDKLICPECGKASSYRKWKSIEYGCDICDYHQGMECPFCKHGIDLTRGRVPKQLSSY